MDVDVLVELIECSVCLERMDTKSKVLPCQHTFCSDCLNTIAVTSKKEIKCPECRSPCSVAVKDLPANILLVRLLEGLKSAGKPIPTKNEVLFTAGKPCAKAMYTFEPREPGDLAFRRGSIINLKKRLDENWYVGELLGKTGSLPATYIQVICPLPDTRTQSSAKPTSSGDGKPEAVKSSATGRQAITVTALYDFEMKDEEEKEKDDCLKFKKGDVIHIIRRIDQNWVEGKLSGVIGIFPRSYVELTHSARALLDTQQRRPLSATVTGSSSQETEKQLASAINASGQVKRHSMNIPPGNTQDKSENLIAAAAASTAISTATGIDRHLNLMESNYQNIPLNVPISESDSPSGDASPTPGSSNELAAFSLDEAVDISSATPLLYKALYNYKPQKADELALQRGALYQVIDKCKDGWYRGSCPLMDTSGVFPGNYVQLHQISDGADNLPNVKQRVRKSVAPPGGSNLSASGDNTSSKQVKQRKELKSQRDEGRQFWGMNAGNVNNVQPQQKDRQKRPAHQSTKTEQSSSPTEKSEILARSPQPISGDIKTSNRQAPPTDEKPSLPVRYKCIAAYPSQSDNELDLKVGDIIYVSKRKLEGWCRGTNASTGKTGLFPDSFVQSYPVRKE